MTTINRSIICRFQVLLPTRSPYPFRSRSSQPSQDFSDIPNTLQLTTRPEDATSFIFRDEWSCLQLEIASLKSAMCALRLQHDEELQAVRAELETMRLSSQNPQPTSQPVTQPAQQTAPQSESPTVLRPRTQIETAPVLQPITQPNPLPTSPSILGLAPKTKKKKKKRKRKKPKKKDKS